MDKAKDFEKGFEEYKAKKKQEIEELGQDIYDNCPDLCENGCGGKPCYKCIAEALHRDNYRKIPENAVVLTREEYEKLKLFEERVRSGVCFTQKEWFDYCQKDSNERTSLLIKAKKDTRKETAEKFAKRLKEIEYALLDMVVQFCQMGEYGKLKHSFMSAEEQAFDVLDIKYGEKVDKVYKRFNEKWSKSIDEICKEITEGKV